VKGDHYPRHWVSSYKRPRDSLDVLTFCSISKRNCLDLTMIQKKAQPNHAQLTNSCPPNVPFTHTSMCTRFRASCRCRRRVVVHVPSSLTVTRWLWGSQGMGCSQLHLL